MAKKKKVKPHTRFALAIAKLGLAHRAASRFLGVDERTVRRWVINDEPMPEATLMLVCVMAKHGLLPADALASIGIDAEKLDREAERAWKGRPSFRREPRYHDEI